MNLAIIAMETSTPENFSNPWTVFRHWQKDTVRPCPLTLMQCKDWSIDTRVNCNSLVWSCTTMEDNFYLGKKNKCVPLFNEKWRRMLKNYKIIAIFFKRFLRTVEDWLLKIPNKHAKKMIGAPAEEGAHMCILTVDSVHVLFNFIKWKCQNSVKPVRDHR